MWVYSGFIWLRTGPSSVIHKGRGFVKEQMSYYLMRITLFCITASGFHKIGQMLTLFGCVNVQIQRQSRSQLSRVFAK